LKANNYRVERYRCPAGVIHNYATYQTAQYSGSAAPRSRLASLEEMMEELNAKKVSRKKEVEQRAVAAEMAEAVTAEAAARAAAAEWEWE
jgi:hypothetical protein